MATSGTALGNNVIVSNPFYARFRIEWQLAGQNTAGNYSTINWQAYIDFVGCDAQLDNGVVSSNVGTHYSNPGRVYNYAANFSNHTVTMGSGSFDIGHNADGTQNLSMSGGIDIFQSGRSNASSAWSLPTINRFATITQFYLDNITDERIRLNWAADVTCNFVSWWSTAYDGAVHHDIAVNGTGLFQITLNQLISNKTYDFQVAVRRADSNLWTNSGVLNATTLLQNKFFDLPEL